MYLFLKIALLFCFLDYVTPSVNIPEIFQKPKPKPIEIPAPKTLDIREATSEEYNCVGRPNGNHANLKDCMSFYACVQNQTYFIVCPEFPDYQTYFNPAKGLCDRSDEFECLKAAELDEDIGIATDKDETEPKSSSSQEENDSDNNDSDSNDMNSGEDKNDADGEGESKEGKSGEGLDSDHSDDNDDVKSGEELDSDEEDTNSNRLDDEL